MCGGVAKQVMEGSVTLLLLLLLLLSELLFDINISGGKPENSNHTQYTTGLWTMFFFWPHKEVILDKGEEGKGNEGISIA